MIVPDGGANAPLAEFAVGSILETIDPRVIVQMKPPPAASSIRLRMYVPWRPCFAYADVLIKMPADGRGNVRE